MNEKELRKKLDQQRAELESTQRSLDQIKYAKQIQIISDTLIESPELLQLLSKHDISTADARIFAKFLCAGLNSIFENSEEILEKNREARIRKNRAKRERILGREYVHEEQG